MRPWKDLVSEEPELAETGERLLFQERIGLAYLATIRKDGAPRLHPVSLVLHQGHLYLLLPLNSPKCGDLLRDGRYALQSFPSPRNVTEEFYLAGRAEAIRDPAIRERLIEEAQIRAGEDEVLFELLLERAMYSTLENCGLLDERPVHWKWQDRINLSST